MPRINYKCTSSVEKHVLANQNVRGSILSWAECSFFGPAQIYNSFYTEITRQNMSSKHERYTRNGANRISIFT